MAGSRLGEAEPHEEGFPGGAWVPGDLRIHGGQVWLEENGTDRPMASEMAAPGVPGRHRPSLPPPRRTRVAPVCRRLTSFPSAIVIVIDDCLSCGELTVSTVTLEDAQARLGELIARLGPGEEILITSADRPVARIVGEPQQAPQPRRLGTMKGTVLSVAPDFDAPLTPSKRRE